MSTTAFLEDAAEPFLRAEGPWAERDRPSLLASRSAKGSCSPSRHAAMFPTSREETLVEEGGLCLGEAISNLVNVMIGSGVLGIPYAFGLSGYWTMALLVVVVSVTSYTALLLGASLQLAGATPEFAEVPRTSRDYAFLAEAAFGRCGRGIAGMLTYFEVWLALVTFLTMNGVNIQLLLGVPAKSAIIGCAAVASFMVYIPMRAYAYVSFVALAALVVASCSIVAYAVSVPVWAHPKLEEQPIVFGGVARSLGLILFCFAGHPCLPPVHENMRDSRQWGLSVGISFAIGCVYYGGVGLLSYTVWGAELLPCITQNIKDTSVYHNVVVLAFTIKVQLTTPVLMKVVHTGLCEFTSGCVNLSAKRSGNCLGACLGEGSVLAVLVVASTALAIFAKDDVAALASLTGSSLVSVTSIFFPTAFYMLLQRRDAGRISLLTTLPCAVAATFGIFLAVSGTYFGVLDLMAN